MGRVLGAAEAALERANATHVRAIEARNRAIGEREAAIFDVMIEEAGILAMAELKPALVELHRVDGKIASLLGFFQAKVDQGHTHYGAAGERAARLIREARQTVGIAQPSDWAQRLQAGLAHDAEFGV